MYRLHRNRPTAPINAARLAAEAAFAPLPSAEPPPEPASNTLIVVKKKRHVDPSANAGSVPGPHEDGADRAPRIFRVPTPLVPEQEGQAESEALPAEQAHPPRRSRKAVAKPGPVVTVQGAPALPALPSIDLAALARELEASMNAREHAEAQAQLRSLEAQLGALDAVLGVIAKARAFTLADTQLSAQWQQLAQAARRLADGLSPAQPTPQSP